MQVHGKSRASGALAIFALVLALGGCGEKSPEALFESAKAEYAKGNAVGAVIHLKGVLQKIPDNGEARYLLGEVYNTLGEYVQADKELQRAQQLGIVKGGRVAGELGYAQVNMQQFQGVLDKVKPVQAYDADGLASVHTVRASAQLGLGKPDLALQEVAEALKAKPGYPRAQLVAAHARLLQGDRDGALAQTEKVLQEAPGIFDGWMLKAQMLRQSGKETEALAAYGKALELRPQSIDALGGRATSQVALKNLDAAQKDVEAMRRINRMHPYSNYLQALVLFRKGKNQDALAAAQTALRFAPDYPPLLLLTGVLQYSLGSYVQAESYATKFLARSPGNAYGRRLLAATLVELKQNKRALETIEPLAGKGTQDWVALTIAGNALMALNNYGKASELFEQASGMQPADPGLRSQLGVSRLGAGKTEQGLADLESALELRSTASRADYLLAMTYLRNKEWDKAIKTAGALAKKDPKNPVPHDIEGLAHLGRKDEAAARKAFERALEIQPVYFPAARNLSRLDLRDKKPDAARARYEKILAADKNNLQALLALAQVALVEGKLKDAIAILERARAANPKALEPAMQLTRYYMMFGDAQKALLVAGEAGKIAPQSADALSLLGEAQMGARDYANAVSNFTAVTKLQPTSAKAHTDLGLAYLGAKNLKASESALRKALELRPDYAEAQAALIRVYTSSQRYGDGLRLAKQMQEQNPKHTLGWSLEGDLMVAQKKYPEAMKAYESAQRLAPNGVFVVKAFMAQTMAGDRPGGVKRLAAWVDAHPDDLTAQRYYAEALMVDGNLKGALDQYQLLTRALPGDALLLNNLAEVFHRMKDPRALATAEKALALAPNDGLIADTVGWILVGEGKTADGLKHLEKAAERRPDVPVIRYHLAAARAKAGEKVRARRELEDLLKSGAKFREIEEAKALLGTL